jgi:DNA polymerase-4
MKEEQRKIIHIDMDAFYASVEQRDHPELRGRPVAVGGNKERGVVAAASYEARKFGVHSALPSARAAKLCPDLIFVKPRFETYRKVSQEIRSIFYQYTDLVEPLSLDEAYLDVTLAKQGPPSATLIAKSIKAEVLEKTQLTASAGISYNKFLAKTASDMDKPDGLFTILPEEAEEFLEKLPIKKFHGIGSATAEKMKHAGIFTGADLKSKSLADLTRRFGKMGAHYYYICRGIDRRQVEPHRERKSVSAEQTFDEDVTTMEEFKHRLAPIMEEVYKRYEKHAVAGRTCTLKVKYSDFKQITRSRSADTPIRNRPAFDEMVQNLITPDLIQEKGIRLLGVGISNFEEDQVQRAGTQLTLKF